MEVDNGVREVKFAISGKMKLLADQILSLQKSQSMLKHLSNQEQDQATKVKLQQEFDKIDEELKADEALKEGKTVSLLYSGEWHGGRKTPHGQGLVVWPNGNIGAGEFKYGYPEG